MNLQRFTGRPGCLNSGRCARLEIPAATPAPDKNHRMGPRHHGAERNELRLRLGSHPAHRYPESVGSLRNRHTPGRNQHRKEQKSCPNRPHQRSMIGTHCELPHLTAANHAVPVCSGTLKELKPQSGVCQSVLIKTHVGGCAPHTADNAGAKISPCHQA
jgi:hypothetical protein